jgi:hypothetical protein
MLQYLRAIPERGGFFAFELPAFISLEPGIQIDCG